MNAPMMEDAQFAEDPEAGGEGADLMAGLTPEQQAGLMALIQQALASGGAPAEGGEESGIDVSQLSDEELTMLEGLSQQMAGQAGVAPEEEEEEEDSPENMPVDYTDDPKTASADWEKMAASYEAVYSFCGAVQAHGFYKEFKKLAAADSDETWPVLRKIAQADISQIDGMLEGTRSEFLEAIKVLGGVK